MLFLVGAVSSGVPVSGCPSIWACWLGRNRRGGKVGGIFRTLK
jgi:hypothetical protein